MDIFVSIPVVFLYVFIARIMFNKLMAVWHDEEPARIPSKFSFACLAAALWPVIIVAFVWTIGLYLVVLMIRLFWHIISTRGFRL